MPNAICCVCNTPIDGPAKTLGSRTFCEKHYNRINRNRRGMWGATLALIVGLVLFVLAINALAPSLRDSLSGAPLLAASLLLALVPAVIWLAVFYLQDRAEPEPKGFLLGVFVLGALLASAVGQPLINNVFRVSRWAGDNLVLKLVAGILIVGAIQEFLKYAAVRYSIFHSSEFDERVDGIIYGAAAGLGYATMLNISYVIGNHGVDLGVGAIRVAVFALAHASFAGITGYFLGRAKFENRGPFWLPVGLFLAALLNGIVTAVLGEITRSGLHATPLNGLIVAAVLAAITFIALFVMVRRGDRSTAAASA